MATKITPLTGLAGKLPLGKLTLPKALTNAGPIPLIVMSIALLVVVPPLLASYWMFLAAAGLLTATTAMGLAMIVGWVGEVTLVGAGLLGASVYVTGYLCRQGDSNWNDWPFIPAAIIGVLTAAVLSGLVA